MTLGGDSPALQGFRILVRHSRQALLHLLNVLFSGLGESLNLPLQGQETLFELRNVRFHGTSCGASYTKFVQAERDSLLRRANRPR